MADKIPVKKPIVTVRSGLVGKPNLRGTKGIEATKRKASRVTSRVTSRGLNKRGTMK